MVAPSTQKGNIGLSVIRTAALKKGYVTSVADEGAVYNVIIDKHDGKLYRVQAKYSNMDETGIVAVRFSIIPTNGKTIDYNKNNIDAIVIYEPTRKRYFGFLQIIMMGRIFRLDLFLLEIIRKKG